jgi:hypothetical protein
VTSTHLDPMPNTSEIHPHYIQIFQLHCCEVLHHQWNTSLPMASLLKKFPFLPTFATILSLPPPPCPPPCLTCKVLVSLVDTVQSINAAVPTAGGLLSPTCNVEPTTLRLAQATAPALQHQLPRHVVLPCDTSHRQIPPIPD